MRQIIDRLAESGSAELHRHVQVRRLAREASGEWSVHGEGSDRWRADAVVLACPSFAQAELLEPLDGELARLLSEIRYNAIAVVALGFDAKDVAHSLDGFGYLSPQRLRRDVLGVLWNSSIFEHRAPAGMVLLQAMCGGWNRPDIVRWDDQRLVRAVLDELRHTMGISASPAFVQIHRWAEAIPQYHLGHLDRVQAIELRRRQWPGLYLTGNSFRGVAVNDCTEEAARCAEELLRGLRGNT
jgi:oxygen-dependent protoporphyrinogen oxidase